MGRVKRQHPVATESNPLGLQHPARTPMPEELRAVASRPSIPVRGKRTIKRSTSGYVAPAATRSSARGEALELRTRLEALRVEVAVGGDLLTRCADGTLLGWRLRGVLSAAVSEPLANWDVRVDRTQGERLAAIDKALAWFGVGAASDAPARRGGWRVTSGG